MDKDPLDCIIVLTGIICQLVDYYFYIVVFLLYLRAFWNVLLLKMATVTVHNLIR